MVAEGSHGNRGLVPSNPSVRLPISPGPPHGEQPDGWGGKETMTMEVIHSRCAGIDISKKDAKVCVRVAGAGRRKTIETVTTWSSMTRQILALREHLLTEQRVARPDLLDPRDQHPDDRGRPRCRDRRQHDPVPPPSTWPPGPGPPQATTSRPGRSSPAGPAPATLTCTAGAAAMACAQNPRTYLGARYRRIASRRGRRRPTSRSSTPCSSRSGTWAQPAPSTMTPTPSSSPDYDLTGAKNLAIHQLEATGYHAACDTAS